MAIFSKRSLEGRLLVDHRASPGTQAVPEGTMAEVPTYTCSHCKRIVVMNPLRTREREFCSACDNYICDECGAERKVSGKCNNFERFVDTYLEAAVKGQPLPIFNPRPLTGARDGK